MPRGAAHALGLDIGTHAIKAVELRRTGEGIELVGTPAVVATPPGSVSNGVIVDGGQVSEALAQMVKTYGFTTRQVIVSVGGESSVVVRIASMPRMEPKELDDAMQWELERQVPFPVDQVIFDYEVIDIPGQTGEDNIDVFLAVAQEDMVDAHVEAIMGAKLTPIHIDVEPLAIGRALVHASDNGYRDQTVLLVHIGANSTGIYIVSNGWMNFVRTLPTAGSAFTAAISENILGDEEQAERAKRQFADLTEAATEESEETGDVAQAQTAIQEAISEALFDLSTEVGRSLEFYRRQHRDAQISAILLCGGSAVIPGLAEFIQNETGVTTEVANPYQHLICDTQQVSKSYLADVGPATVVAVGLAMRDMLED